jgi:hypothetical protein
VTAERSVPLADDRAAWPEVARLAKSHGQPGCKIRVKDETGQIVMLTGVATRRRHAREAAA